jgi:hypothetical protein
MTASELPEALFGSSFLPQLTKKLSASKAIQNFIPFLLTID